MAILVMDGTYRNPGFGSGSVANNAVVSISNVRALLLTALPGHSPVIPSPATQRPCFDGVEGGRKRVSDVFTHKNSGSCI